MLWTMIRECNEKKMPKKITPQRLKNIALYYLKRFETSEYNLRSVLKRRIDDYAYWNKEFNKKIVFYDIIYNKETPFKKFAAKNKIKYFSGEGMLIYQGAVSFDKWTGIFPDTKKTLPLIKKFMR